MPLDLPDRQTPSPSQLLLSLISVVQSVTARFISLNFRQLMWPSRLPWVMNRTRDCQDAPHLHQNVNSSLHQTTPGSLFLDITGVEIRCSELCLSLCCQCLQINEVNPAPVVSETVKEWSNQLCIHEVIIKWLM